MVVALLLSEPKKPLRYPDLGRVAIQCLQGIHSMCKALSILHSSIVSCRELKIPKRSSATSSPPSRILSALDPHVADSGCQTRAQMIWDLVQLYSQPDKKRSLEDAISMLEQLRLQASSLVQDIEGNRGKKRNPDLAALTTHLSVWQRIGFTRFQEQFSGSAEDSSEVNAPPTTPSEDPQTKSTLPTNSSHKRRNISVEAEWDPENLFIVARFLAICFLLSEYRIAQVKTGSPMRVVFRVDLVTMYTDIERELEGLGLVSTEREAKCFDGTAKVNSQYDTMQTYISIVTADWARKAAMKLGLDDLNQSLSDGLITASCRRISCIATYPSALLVRAAWLMSDIPILVVIQRFCSHGEFHTIYCRIVRTSDHDETLSPAHLWELGEHHWFHVSIVSAPEVTASAWARLPHIVMVGNSAGEGTSDDFLRLLLDRTQGKSHPSQPHWGVCQEIADYTRKLGQLNFARFMAHSAASDDQFPFPLPNDEDAHDKVSLLMQKGLNESAGETFKKAKDGAESYGAGKTNSMFAIEHIVMEYPTVVLKELREEPGIYGCKLEI